ncbi:hypothetical protein EDD17DRAFT_1421022, partial [Pisolithus thermaeus]
DLIVHHGAHPISEYNNPDLFPGMFPTLFPFGIGGFEVKSRPTALSFQLQAHHSLTLSDCSFRYHQFYVFVVWNLLQRCLAHIHTSLSCRKSNFQHVAHKITQLSPEILECVASHLEREHKVSDMSTDEKRALDLLKHVNAISACVPGSEASKIFTRNEIRSYYGFFGLPHLFFTFNPSVAHSPLFQVMYGDHTVDLSHRFPCLVSAREHAIRLAHDPVAAADFFHFSVMSCFQYLLGWDYKNHSSSPSGGLFGRLRAFYGTSE